MTDEFYKDLLTETNEEIEKLHNKMAEVISKEDSFNEYIAIVAILSELL